MQHKKISWIFVIIFLLILSFNVNAEDVEFKVFKENYKSFETLQFEVSFNGVKQILEINQVQRTNNQLNILITFPYFTQYRRRYY